MVSSLTSINGSDVNETLNGSAGDDLISTTYANPTIYAGEGNDTVSASVNSDTASSIYIEGGDGNDQLSATQIQVFTPVLMPMPGFDPLDPLGGVGGPGMMLVPKPAITPSDVTIIGGAGEDTIAVKSFNYGTLSIEAGDDNDTVYISGVTVDASVDLGTGDDTVTLTGATATSITSGAGSDTIVLDSWGLIPSQTPVVTDFTAGTGGDVLDFSHIITYLQADYGLAVDGNPYEDGFITAEQDGADVVFYLDADASGTGYSATKLITLQGVTLTKLTTANFADGLGNYAVANAAPEVGTEIKDIEVAEDTAINVTLDKGIFTDADNDPLTLKLTLEDGTAAPAWLSYSAATHAIVGTPPANFTGTLSLKLTASDAAESASQTFDLTVTNVNDTPTGGVTIRGTAIEDGTLTADVSALKDADGLGTLSYSWLRDGVAISGATAATYTLGDADVGAAIKVQVTYTDGHGAREAVTSAATSTVTNVNDAPTGGISINGTFKENATLTMDMSVLKDADGLGKSYTLQWFANDVAISGATAAAYTLTRQDVGKTLSVKMIYMDQHGTLETVVGTSTEVVISANHAPEGEVVITGTASVGNVLTADTTDLSDADGLGTLSYVWLRNDQVIEGEKGATFTLTESDSAAEIKVQVSYVDDQGTSETVTSAATEVELYTPKPPLPEEPTDPVVPQPSSPTFSLTFGADTLRSGAGNDSVFAGAGSDTVFGGFGNDTIRGGLGNDLVQGNRGGDLLYGGHGGDTLLAGQGDDKVFGGLGNDTVLGGFGDDTVRGGTGNDFVSGGAGLDTIWGGGGADTINGGRHADIMHGGDDADMMFGNLGDDTIYGADGADTIVGGGGNDLLAGGEGADTFLFSRLGAGEDTVFDFTADDTLVFSGTWQTSGYVSEAAFLERYAHEAYGGVIIELERGNSVFLSGLSSVSDLAGHVLLSESSDDIFG
ncbi:calcium-binding protein [Donghicola mangrovi]|uniref:Type I secretion C-terminal target domain-containing protein n=1 Tax=Donghicola mangrovi TaxID=2729614 RepID=A0A850QBY2_9RHOB|nr:calcium-binding protein [Donghicola mangrovi]NVO24380.1 type I secretion C-terminal target domain-containing protein [Donghicola mangrovi]